MNSTHDDFLPSREFKRGSFITSIDVPENNREVDEIRSQINAKVIGLHQELNTVVENLEGKVRDIVERQEREFFFAYRSHMSKIQRDLNDLRLMMNEEQNKQLKNDKIKKLEKELEWFKKESLLLNERLKEKTKENEDYKAQLTVMKEDYKFLDKKMSAQSNIMNIVLNQKTARVKHSAKDELLEKNPKSKIINSTSTAPSSSNPSGSSSFLPSPMKSLEQHPKIACPPNGNISQQAVSEKCEEGQENVNKSDSKQKNSKRKPLRPSSTEQKKPKEDFLSESEEEEICLELNNIFRHAAEEGAIKDYALIREVKTLIKAYERKIRK